MKVLLVAPASDFARQIHAALEGEGHAVAYLDDRLDYALPSHLRTSRLLWRIGRRIPWWRRWANEALQRRVLEASKGTDIVLATKGMNIKKPTLEELRHRGARTAVWFPDNAANEPYASWVREVGPLWSRFISFDSAIMRQVPLDMRGRTHVVPFGVDPALWDPEPLTDADRAEFSCDVCCIGAPYPERVGALMRVAGSVDLRIWGWGGWRRTPLARFWRGPLDARGSAKAYRLAKITLNTNVRPLADGVNLKTFEICAAGGFQLTDEPRDLAASFDIGRELDSFHDDAEFEQKVRYWLAHERERDHVAAAGRSRMLRDHALNARIREILSLVIGH